MNNRQKKGVEMCLIRERAETDTQQPAPKENKQGLEGLEDGGGQGWRTMLYSISSLQTVLIAQYSARSRGGKSNCQRSMKRFIYSKMINMGHQSPMNSKHPHVDPCANLKCSESTEVLGTLGKGLPQCHTPWHFWTFPTQQHYSTLWKSSHSMWVHKTYMDNNWDEACTGHATHTVCFQD